MQRGFSAWVVIVLVTVVGLIGFILGARTNPKQDSPIQKLNNVFSLVNAKMGFVSPAKNSEEATLTAQILKSASPLPAQSARPKLAFSDSSMIVSTGVFQFSDHKINYTFYFPKSGGDIKGELEGVCNGDFNGKYDGGEENSISGTFNGVCTAGPLDLIKTDLKAAYTGNLSKKNNKIYIQYDLTNPTSYRGSFELGFSVQ